MDLKARHPAPDVARALAIIGVVVMNYHGYLIIDGARRDGGWAYDNREREIPLPAEGWRASTSPLRVRLPPGVMIAVDVGGVDLAQDPSLAFGDPVVRRRDGAIAYHLASVVDDDASGVTHVVRGRDLATSSAMQVALRQVLGLSVPTYRHHLLLLERIGHKWAKLHGAVGASELRRSYSAPQLCGWLAAIAGLRPEAEPCTPADLLSDFSWDHVRRDDVLVHWTGERLEVANG